jgi:glycosyltransferase involved in cell wall biosynthesis
VILFEDTLKRQSIAAFSQIAALLLRRQARSRNGTCSGTINVVSYYGKHNGISQGATLQCNAFRKLGIDAYTVDVTAAMNNPFSNVRCNRADLFVIHCAGPDFVRLIWPLRRYLSQSKVIAYFAWEFANPPPWPKWDFLWDEIWTPSSFSAKALSSFCGSKVEVVPHVVLDRAVAPRSWSKGTERLTFLTMADTRSSLARKNPFGAITAFIRAFPTETDVELVVKLNGPSGTPQFAKLIESIKTDSRIRPIHGTLDRENLELLIETAHVFVSLHRAEGFGIPLLEAQSRGLATIATGWSGNLDFMTAETSVLIPYALATMQDEDGIYGREVTWADPDIDAAAQAMRRFYEDPAELARFAQAGWLAAAPDVQIERFRHSLQLAGVKS